MTPEEALDILERGYPYSDEEYIDALQVACNALRRVAELEARVREEPVIRCNQCKKQVWRGSWKLVQIFCDDCMKSANTFVGDYMAQIRLLEARVKDLEELLKIEREHHRKQWKEGPF